MLSGEVAWVLNLDAEEELEMGAKYREPRRSMTQKIEEVLPRLLLVRAGDRVVWPSADPARGMFGRAWCPTRTALERMRSAGVLLPKGPPIEVLLRVNHRSFSAELGQDLPGARYVRTRAELLEALAASPISWLLKRPFGFAGKKRRKLGLASLDAADERWIEASLKDGEGLQVEPWVTRIIDCAMHGYLEEDGALRLGRPTVQRCDPYGAWASSVLDSGELAKEESSSLREEGERVAGHLRLAGYFGPFGIDGFRWRDEGGRVRFRPRSEINARYSMGWPIGMGEFRPAPGSP